MIVSKFGGSSVANSTQFKKVKNIISQNHERKVVVISALGKKNPDDIKTTDLLYLLHSQLKNNIPHEETWNKIKKNFLDIKQELNLTIDLDFLFSAFQKEFSNKISKDYVASRGEYFTSKLMAEFLGFTFIDAKDVIRINYDETVDYKTTFSLIKAAFQKHNNIVIPGFYGAYRDLTIKTFSRGGSDVTGAIVASALKGSCYENWTDVSGVLIADPNIIKNAKRIDEISYAELRTLSYMGANVLHEETILPVKDANIPIRILNTNHPDGKGTLVTGNCGNESYLIKGIAGKKDFATLAITRKAEISKIRVIQQVLKILSDQGIDIEQVVSNVDSLSLVVPKNQLKEKENLILGKLKECTCINDVKADYDIALISILGRKFMNMPGVAGNIFGIFKEQNVNVKLITYGINDLSIIVGISIEEYERSISALYEKLVELSCNI